MTEIASNDPQWQALADAWTSAAPTPAPDGLRSHARRGRRRLLATAAGEGLLVLGLLALSAFVVAGEVAAWEATWLVTMWGFAAVAVGFSWWNRRATWRAAGESVDEYLRLCRRRCERGLLALQFAGLLFVAEAVVVVAQLAFYDRLVPIALVALLAAGLLVLAWCVVARRRLRRELARVTAFAAGDRG